MQQNLTDKEIKLADLIKNYMNNSTNLQEIVQKAYEQLKESYNEKEIAESINKFIETKYLVRGFTLTKRDVLDNQKRKEILQYIAKSPGCHGRAIRNSLKLGSNEFSWHISLLESFGLIKRLNSDDIEGFLLNRSYQDYESVLVWYQHPKAQKILKICAKNSRTALEISKEVKMHYNTVKKYLERLLETQLIQQIEQERPKKYLTNQEFITKLKKIINSAFFDDFSSE